MSFDLRGCLRGDKRAWEAFVERFAPVIHAAVRRTLRARAPRIAEEDIHDVVQEVFVRLVRDDYRRLRAFDASRASLVTWLTVVARSVAIDELRRRRPPAVQLDEQSLEVAASDAPPAEGVEIPAGLLSPRQRLVLRLLFEKDLPVAEVARLLGIEEQTVRSTRHKAISKLREHLGRR